MVEGITEIKGKSSRDTQWLLGYVQNPTVPLKTNSWLRVEFMSLDRVYVKIQYIGMDTPVVGFLTDYSSKMYSIRAPRLNLKIAKKAFSKYGEVLPDVEQERLTKEATEAWLKSRKFNE